MIGGLISRDADDRLQDLSEIDGPRLNAAQLRIQAGDGGNIGNETIEPVDILQDDGE